jgi:hypothetical protein
MDETPFYHTFYSPPRCRLGVLKNTVRQIVQIHPFYAKWYPTRSEGSRLTICSKLSGIQEQERKSKLFHANTKHGTKSQICKLRLSVITCNEHSGMTASHTHSSRSQCFFEPQTAIFFNSQIFGSLKYT